MKYLLLLTLVCGHVSAKSGGYYSECLEFNDENYCSENEQGDDDFDRASPHDQDAYESCVTGDDEKNCDHLIEV